MIPIEGDVECRLQVAGRELVFLAPPSVDALLEGVEDADAIPFWAQIWDSAFGMCQFLEAKTPWFRRACPSLRLLELGCGVGVVGCAAAALGWDVTLSDHRAEPLEYAEANLRRNGLTARVAQADWRDFQLQDRFDLVAGSDILYEPSLHGSLASILRMQGEQGALAALADPGRGYAVDFAALREKEGWQVELEFYKGRQAMVALYLMKAPAQGPTVGISRETHR